MIIPLQQNQVGWKGGGGVLSYISNTGCEVQMRPNFYTQKEPLG